MTHYLEENNNLNDNRSFIRILGITHYLKYSSSQAKECSVTHSCPTVCDPMNFSPPGASACGIFQARILEWVAISFSKAKERYDQIFLLSNKLWPQYRINQQEGKKKKKNQINQRATATTQEKKLQERAKTAREMARMAKPGENGSSTCKCRSHLNRNSVSSNSKNNCLKVSFQDEECGRNHKKEELKMEIFQFCI